MVNANWYHLRMNNVLEYLLNATPFEQIETTMRTVRWWQLRFITFQRTTNGNLEFGYIPLHKHIREIQFSIVYDAVAFYFWFSFGKNHIWQSNGVKDAWKYDATPRAYQHGLFCHTKIACIEMNGKQNEQRNVCIKREQEWDSDIFGGMKTMRQFYTLWFKVFTTHRHIHRSSRLFGCHTHSLPNT